MARTIKPGVGKKVAAVAKRTPKLVFKNPLQVYKPPETVGRVPSRERPPLKFPKAKAKATPTKSKRTKY